MKKNAIKYFLISVTLVGIFGCASSTDEKKSVDKDVSTIKYVFEDNFDGTTLDNNKWKVTPTGNVSYTVVNGALNANIAGGSNGFMGNWDKIDFTPNYTKTTGNIVIETKIKELSRIQKNGRVNSGIGMSYGDDNAGISIGIWGNGSGYHPDNMNKSGFKYYNTFEGHGINISAGKDKKQIFWKFIPLDLNTMYEFELAIEYVNSKWDVKYRKANDSLWTKEEINVLDVPPNKDFKVTFGSASGDGGYTYENGTFSAALDYFRIGE